MSTQSARWIATARLLRRTGFGTTGPRVDALQGQDVGAYLDGVLNLDPESDPGARATPMPDYPDVPKYPGEKADGAAALVAVRHSREPSPEASGKQGARFEAPRR
ncbi:MAG: hypothetical protein QOI28_5092 [Mycobacterium sp.]|jgi:hypothetical protein|nr:hypothetical protein [Mycobacterium sp.]